MTAREARAAAQEAWRRYAVRYLTDAPPTAAAADEAARLAEAATAAAVAFAEAPVIVRDGPGGRAER